MIIQGYVSRLVLYITFLFMGILLRGLLYVSFVYYTRELFTSFTCNAIRKHGVGKLCNQYIWETISLNVVLSGSSSTTTNESYGLVGVLSYFQHQAPTAHLAMLLLPPPLTTAVTTMPTTLMYISFLFFFFLLMFFLKHDNFFPS